MKKIFSIVMAFGLFIGAINAQVMPATFTDNVAVQLKGGVSTPLNDPFDGVSPMVGLEVEKYINPWLGVSVDANTLIANPYGYLNPHTAFDVVNINGLVKFNLINLFGKFDGKRHFFEPVIYTGLGWGHRTCSEFATRNYVTYKAGAELNFNFGSEKQWGARFNPAVVWGPADGGRLHIDNGGLELTAGIVYRFKNHDGNRTFTMAKLYDEGVMNDLNSKINELRATNRELKETNDHLLEALKNQKVEVQVVEKTNTVTLIPHIQFEQGNYKVAETSMAAIKAIAEYMKANPDRKFELTGYASVEGGKSFNQTLSERRASYIKSLLEGFGVNPDQIVTKGKGATDKFSKDHLYLNRVVVVE